MKDTTFPSMKTPSWPTENMVTKGQSMLACPDFSRGLTL